jgi:hypothetical protein
MSPIGAPHDFRNVYRLADATGRLASSIAPPGRSRHPQPAAPTIDGWMHQSEIRRRQAAAQARTATIITDHPAARPIVPGPALMGNASWQRVAITGFPGNVLGGP